MNGSDAWVRHCETWAMIAQYVEDPDERVEWIETLSDIENLREPDQCSPT